MADPHSQLAWHHLKCVLPPDWEVTAYSIEPRIGRLEFSTRQGLQALLSWEPCGREPDPDTTMRDFLEKLFPASGLSANLASEIKIGRCGSWMLGAAARGPAKALWYRPEQKILLSWVFEPSARDAMQAILGSSVPNEGAQRDYQIHGVHARVPANFDIEAMHVYAANVMIHFESDKRRRLIFRRWGMPHLVLDGRTLLEFAPWMLRAAGNTVQDSKEETLEGMPAVLSRFSMKPTFQLDKFMGRRWHNGEALLWLNPGEKRIYSFEQIGPSRTPALDLYDCNPELRHG